jgi:FKBP-type peptidyl-prolyl cis-trans isomerase FklB
MKTKTTGLVIMALIAATAAVQADETNSPFSSLKEKASYAIGLNMGNNWKNSDVELDYDFVLRGLNDTRGDKPLLNQDQIRETLQQFKAEYDAKLAEKRRVLGEKNKAEGAAYLEANKKKPGVVTTESGLQYKIITEGEGDSPGPQDIVTVNYRGTLVDGTEFDSSAKTGKPAQFRVNGVIPGWTEALLKMKPGAKWELAIPSNLAYGDNARSQLIGPGATLLFDIELISVEPAPPSPHRPAMTSDIIKVPSAEEMKKGAKIETIKPEDLERMQKEEQEKKKQQQ